jgi:hypothetical protein
METLRSPHGFQALRSHTEGTAPMDTYTIAAAARLAGAPKAKLYQAIRAGR